jgi:hypothetical protein
MPSGHTRSTPKAQVNRTSGGLGLRSRFDLVYALGRVPRDQRMATIELFGREPHVRALLAASDDGHEL